MVESLQMAFPLPKWCPRPDLNRDKRFRKPLLYPVELRGHSNCRINSKAGPIDHAARPRARAQKRGTNQIVHSGVLSTAKPTRALGFMACYLAPRPRLSGFRLSPVRA